MKTSARTKRKPGTKTSRPAIRKPGVKKVRAKGKIRRLTLPPFPDPQVPKGLSGFAAFWESLEGEIPFDEARHVYQEEWCEHPRSAQRLTSTWGSLVEQDFMYTRACRECGKATNLKGRPPSWLVRQ